jgi:PAS domain S-box-containing protein
MSETTSSSALGASELEFRRLLERLPAGAYTCDAGGLITFYNERAVALWGRAPKLNDPADRFCGSFKLLLTDGTPISHEDCWMARALKTGKDFNGEEIVVERPDGVRLTVLAHANPIRDAAGQLIGAVNVLVDISERKVAEDAQRFLAAIVESSEDAIISKSLTGIILSWNRGAQQLFGHSAAEAIGQPITMLIPPERQHEEQSILARLRQGKKIEHYETVRQTKCGRRIDISLTVSPIRDSSGRIIAASKVARDISPQKKAQQALLALKDELATQLADLRRLHDLSTRLSSTLDLQTILDETLQTAAAIDECDKALLSLCDEDGKFLKLVASLGFGPKFLAQADCMSQGGACGKCLEERRRVIIEDTEVEPDFEPFREAARQGAFRAVHCTPLLSRAGQMIGVLSTHCRHPRRPSDRAMHLIDLCARHAVEFIENARLYAEVQAADRSKDEFLAVLAHELRNPLAPIRNSLHILRLSGDLTPATEHVQEVLERQVNHLVRLVDDLLEISRISQGKFELRKEPVELASVIVSAVETSRPLIDEARHQLAISIPPQPLMLEADGVRVAQIVANLLNNAAKYTDAGGQIWLTAQQEAGQIVIAVRDTGIGIDPKQLPHVFEMFAQIQSAGRRAGGGLGIGLTLVKRLTEMHGGSVEAKSEGLGHGSEFIIRLPLAKKTLVARSSEPPKAERPRPLAGRRILVVDDNRDAADSLAMFLKFLGAGVQVAYDATTALSALGAFRPTIVLLDIGMPLIDGYEAARRIRAMPEGQAVLLVAMTGWGQDEDRRRTADAGFDHHLVKPVDPTQLQNVLAEFEPSSLVEPSGT